MSSISDLIEKRKAMTNEDDGDDFVVGTIAGLDAPSTMSTPSQTRKNTIERGKKNIVDSTVVNQQQAFQLEEMPSLENTVSLKFKRDYLALVERVASINAGSVVQDFGAYYQLNAPFIRVTRRDVESVLGKISDGRWRMLFMNRDGEVTLFTDNEFILGTPEIEAESQRKELAQLNTRIDASVKIEMDEVRELLGMTQAHFLEVAIREFAIRVRAELI